MARLSRLRAAVFKFHAHMNYAVTQVSSLRDSNPGPSGYVSSALQLGHYATPPSIKCLVAGFWIDKDHLFGVYIAHPSMNAVLAIYQEICIFQLMTTTTKQVELADWKWNGHNMETLTDRWMRVERKRCEEAEKCRKQDRNRVGTSLRLEAEVDIWLHRLDRWLEYTCRPKNSN